MTSPAERRPRRRLSAANSQVDELANAVLTASRVLIGVSAASLADVEDAVTLTQFRTLVVLDGRGETNLNGLAEQLGVNSSTAMRMVDRLLAAGLVTRQDNPANRREVILALSPAGAALVGQVTDRRRAEITRIVRRMRPAQRDGLVRALSAFADAAGEPDSAPASSLGW
jgi:DNA-binding MarR family transcriptional regulator